MSAAPAVALQGAVPLYNTDFAQAIARNKRNTLILVAVLLGIAALLGYVIGWAWSILPEVERMPPQQSFSLTTFLVVRDLATGPVRREAVIGALVILGMSCVWSMVTLIAGPRILAAVIGARDASAVQPAEKQFLDVVEEMAIAAGLPAPRAMVLETEALNAFASGLSPKRSMITATSGLLEALNREELQGVVGHEMSHIADYDVRYVTVVASMVGALVLVRELFLRRGLLSARGRRVGRGNAVLAIYAILLLVVVLAPIAAALVQLAISRQREYMADATSVKLTRDPAGLIHALERLKAGDTTLAGRDSPVTALCIAPPSRFSVSELLATHPPLADRIERLRNLGGVAAPAQPAPS